MGPEDFDDMFDFDTGFFDYTERRDDDIHPQDEVENAINCEIEQEEQDEY